MRRAADSSQTLQIETRPDMGVLEILGVEQSEDEPYPQWPPCPVRRGGGSCGGAVQARTLAVLHERQGRGWLCIVIALQHRIIAVLQYGIASHRIASRVRQSACSCSRSAVEASRHC